MQAVQKDIKKLQDKQERFEYKLDELQDSHERMDADIRTMSGEIAGGFYKTKHQIRALDDQIETVIKVLELKDILPLVKSR